jgi:hypothetical protein
MLDNPTIRPLRCANLLKGRGGRVEDKCHFRKPAHYLETTIMVRGK